MPYYKWKGIDLAGTTNKGVIRASSAADLEVQLFKNDIAILSSRQIKTRRVRSPLTERLLPVARKVAEVGTEAVTLPPSTRPR